MGGDGEGRTMVFDVLWCVGAGFWMDWVGVGGSWVVLEMLEMLG